MELMQNDYNLMIQSLLMKAALVATKIDILDLIEYYYQIATHLPAPVNSSHPPAPAPYSSVMGHVLVPHLTNYFKS